MTSQLLIDVGTSHTVAVLRRDGQAPRPVIFDGSPLLPSGVYRDDAGGLLVGRDALRLAAVRPNRFEPYPKRRVDDGTVLLGDTPVPVAELLAAPMRRVLAETGPATVALTCPADWGAPRRDVLRAAAHRAGLADVPLIDEPIAAATYCAEVLGQPLPPAAHLLVFDFGGGTLDVAVVRHDPPGPAGTSWAAGPGDTAWATGSGDAGRATGPGGAGWATGSGGAGRPVGLGGPVGRLRVVAVGGLDDLGGMDVDAALAGHLGALIAVRDPAAWHRLDAARGAVELRDRLAFWSEVRIAKEMLSRTAAAPVQVPGREEALHLTRAELERIAGPLVDRAVDEARRVLSRAAVPPPDRPGGLAGILLVGGSSRMPLVATRLHTRLGVAPTVPEQPELPVAYGGLLLMPPTSAATPSPQTHPDQLRPDRFRPDQLRPDQLRPDQLRPDQHRPDQGRPAPIRPGPGWMGQDRYSQGEPVQDRPATPFPISAPPDPVSATPAAGFPASAPTSPGAGPTSPAGPARPAGRAGAAGVGGGPVPGRRAGRRSRGWVVLASVVSALVVLAGVVGLGATVVPGIGRAIWGDSGPLTGIGASSVRPLAGYPVALGSSGQVALTGGGGAFYAALGGSGSTAVRAVDAGTGRRRWQVSVPVAPAELTLRAVGDLVLVDAGRSATNAGKDIRVVLAAADGHQLWSGDWSDRTDVAYLGTDALVDVQQGEPFRTALVDLRTGRERWSHSSSTDEIIANRRVGAALGWPAATTATPAGVAVPTGPFQEPFAVDPTRVVELDSEDGLGAVLAATTGHVTTSGALPLDDKAWTVYDGLVIGALTDDASPGQPAVGAYRLGDLSRAWTYKLNPGDDVKLVHPCGQHLVCVSADGSDSNTLTAVRTTTGAAAWPKPISTDPSFDPGAYVLNGQLLYGEATFDSMLGGPTEHNWVLDPATGGHHRDLDTPYLMAGAARYAVQVDPGGGAWRVRLLDPATGRSSGWLDTGSDDLPVGEAVSGHSFAVVTKDRRLSVATTTLPA